MERKSLIVLAVLVTLSVITPKPDGMAATAATADQPATGQRVIVNSVGLAGDAEPRCIRTSSGDLLLALPGSISI